MTNKAERPCTLPWGVTFDFNDFKFCSLRGGLNRNETLQRLYVKLTNGDTLYSPYYTEEQAWEVYNQVLLAIASSQSPWLKAEGFEFVEGEVYFIMCRDESTFLIAKYTNNDFLGDFHMAYSDGNLHNSNYESTPAQRRCYKPVAFKPISDSQAVWKQYENVEVYKEAN